MTLVQSYKILSKQCMSKWYQKVINWVLRRKNDYLFEIELTLKSNMGVWAGNLLIFNSSAKGVVLRSEQNIVVVKTIKASKDIKQISTVRLLARKWYNHENIA